MQLDDLMHPRDVAKRYKMTPESLSNWRREGKGPPFVKLGTGKSPRVMYRVKDVAEWEKQNLTNTD